MVTWHLTDSPQVIYIKRNQRNYLSWFRISISHILIARFFMKSEYNIFFLWKMTYFKILSGYFFCDTMLHSLPDIRSWLLIISYYNLFITVPEKDKNLQSQVLPTLHVKTINVWLLIGCTLNQRLRTVVKFREMIAGSTTEMPHNQDKLMLIWHGSMRQVIDYRNSLIRFSDMIQHTLQI